MGGVAPRPRAGEPSSAFPSDDERMFVGPMHDPAVRRNALALSAAGENDCEIARRLGVPRTTVRDWRAPRYTAVGGVRWERCPRCWLPGRATLFTAADYAFLLGLYLGDGYISWSGRTWRFRLYLDRRHPVVADEAQAVLGRCFAGNRVNRGTHSSGVGSCHVLSVYSSHLPCLFPQHGTGKKHDRVIRLEGWQEATVKAHPWRLLKGLVWSDGSTFVNRTGRYEYLSFEFSNLSEDLLELFADTCESVGISYRRYPAKERGGRRVAGQVRINKRADVARLLHHVGIKR